MKDSDAPRRAGLCLPPPAYQQEAEQAQDERIGRGDRVINDDRAGGDRGRKAKPAAEHERARHLEVAEVARAGRHREAQQQCRVRGHRLPRRDVDADRCKKQREVEGVQHESDRRESRESRCQRRRPQPACSGAEGERLAGERRRKAGRQHAAREGRSRHTRSEQRGAEHGAEQPDRQRCRAQQAARGRDHAGRRDHRQNRQHERHAGEVARLVDDDGRQG